MSLANDEKALISAFHNYQEDLRHVNVSNYYFAAVHDQYYDITKQVFKLLIQNGELDRHEEFLEELELFKFDMIRKFASTGMYDNCPRSHFEKVNRIPHSDDKATAIAELRRKRYEYEDDDYSF
ncbi:hypothetical protein BCT76_09685 [Vibrio tasmaniensis]|uniref:hypothetical protein n=1 Tax=Vibrio tasmaniensis TaxID=212663 RepID=UPI000C86332B|nr:hypothetical protein [Vibrio tasmaniensis]PML48753.1 hypothetical protein BCT76_09685 [Vibrio tasmaniensis]